MTDDMFITRRIYYIKCNLDNIIYYVSSTKNKLGKRLTKHRVSYKRWQNYKNEYNLSIYKKFNEFGVTNFSIGLIKEYKLIDRNGIFAMETLWKNKLKNNFNYCIQDNIQPFNLNKIIHKY